MGIQLSWNSTGNTEKSCLSKINTFHHKLIFLSAVISYSRHRSYFYSVLLYVNNKITFWNNFFLSQHTTITSFMKMNQMVITMNIEVSIRNAMDDSTNFTSWTPDLLHFWQNFFTYLYKIKILFYLKIKTDSKL